MILVNNKSCAMLDASRTEVSQMVRYIGDLVPGSMELLHKVGNGSCEISQEAEPRDDDLLLFSDCVLGNGSGFDGWTGWKRRRANGTR